jgi:hypothetical protein
MIIFMRKMKYFFLLMIAAALVIGGCGGNTKRQVNIQPEDYPGWVQVKAGDDATFAVPPQLAPETDEFRNNLMRSQDTDLFVKTILSRDEMIAKANGSAMLVSTDFTKTPWEPGTHYARVTFQTLTSPMKMPRYGQNLGMDEKAIKEFDKATQEGVQFAVSRSLPEGYKIECRNWTPMKTQIVNGIEHLYVTYDEVITRDGQPVMILNVRRWTFLNSDRLHVLIAYTNAADKTYWEDPHRNISNLVKTLVITPSCVEEEDSGILGKIKSLF